MKSSLKTHLLSILALGVFCILAAGSMDDSPSNKTSAPPTSEQQGSAAASGSSIGSASDKAEDEAMAAFMEKAMSEQSQGSSSRRTFHDDGSEYPYPKGPDGCPLSTNHFPGITLDMPPAERVRRCRTNANRMLCYDGAAEVEKAKKLCYIWGELSRKR